MLKQIDILPRQSGKTSSLINRITPDYNIIFVSLNMNMSNGVKRRVRELGMDRVNGYTISYTHDSSNSSHSPHSHYSLVNNIDGLIRGALKPTIILIDEFTEQPSKASICELIIQSEQDKFDLYMVGTSLINQDVSEYLPESFMYTRPDLYV